MAERRMFARTIVESDAFLDMPLSAQSLYVHLAMSADDWGFVNNPRSIRRMCGASEDDLRILVAKKFILTFDSGAAVIKSWWVNNYVKSDRRRDTRYQDELATLYIDENKSYTLKDTGVRPADMFKRGTKVEPVWVQSGSNLEPEWNQSGSKVEPQVRLGKDRLGESTSNSSRVDTQPNPKGFGACAPEQPKKRRAKKFVKPSVEEVAEYAEGFIKSRNLRLTGETFRAERFVSWYDSNGWKVGKNPMKDWKGAVRTWIFKDYVDDSATATAVDAKALDAFDFAGTL
ncbi:hypothetical protein ABG984_05910 [Collinsella aerofaciens]|uniref:hypothetical protein n=1 Tax=Collinsella aerofaciens TaxID=74426 RepID=UPI00325A464A